MSLTGGSCRPVQKLPFQFPVGGKELGRNGPWSLKADSTEQDTPAIANLSRSMSKTFAVAPSHSCLGTICSYSRSFYLKKKLDLFICIEALLRCMYMYVHVCIPGARRPEESIDFPETGVYGWLYTIMWVLGTKFRSPVRTSGLNPEPSLQSHSSRPSSTD